MSLISWHGSSPPLLSTQRQEWVGTMDTCTRRCNMVPTARILWCHSGIIQMAVVALCWLIVPGFQPHLSGMVDDVEEPVYLCRRAFAPVFCGVGLLASLLMLPAMFLSCLHCVRVFTTRRCMWDETSAPVVSLARPVTQIRVPRRLSFSRRHIVQGLSLCMFVWTIQLYVSIFVLSSGDATVKK